LIASVGNDLWINICDDGRSFRAIEIEILSCGEKNLAVTGENVDRFTVSAGS